MNTQEIKDILGSYFEGKTTLEEERQLKEFFASGEVPAELQKYGPHFRFLASESGRQIPDKKFSRKLDEKMGGTKVTGLFPVRTRSLVYWLSGIAAGIALIITVFLKSDPYVKQLESTYTDPQLAYNEAKKVLLFVSSKLNTGTTELEKLGRLDAGTQELQTLSKFDEGMETTSGTISRYNKLEKIINP